MYFDSGRKPEGLMGNPCMHRENMQTPHRKAQPGFEPGTLIIYTIYDIIYHSHYN